VGVVDVSALEWIEVTWDEARGSAAASIAFGSGEAHVRALRIDPGGEVGLHETGSGQLFVPIQVGRGFANETAKRSWRWPRPHTFLAAYSTRREVTYSFGVECGAGSACAQWPARTPSPPT
jgi:hypothetical protein